MRSPVSAGCDTPGLWGIAARGGRTLMLVVLWLHASPRSGVDDPERCCRKLESTSISPVRRHERRSYERSPVTVKGSWRL